MTRHDEINSTVYNDNYIHTKYALIFCMTSLFFHALCELGQNPKGLPADTDMVLVSRLSRDALRPRSHLGWTGKLLSLGNEHLGLMHKSFFHIF